MLMLFREERVNRKAAREREEDAVEEEQPHEAVIAIVQWGGSLWVVVSGGVKEERGKKRERERKKREREKE